MNISNTCADPESFVRWGQNLITFFLLANEGIEDPNTVINGLGSFVSFQGFRISIAKKLYFFVFFQGGGEGGGGF